jgi:hypothetical protein
MRATVLRLIATGLGTFVLAAFSLVRFDFLCVNDAPAFVFAAIDPGCQIVDEANNKLLNTPWHSYTTTMQGPSGSVSPSVESIFVGGITYTQAEGIWYAMPIAAQPANGNTEPNNGKKNPQRICHHLRDELFNGDKIAVYSVHIDTTEVGNIDFLYWISNSRGLISRIEYYPEIKKGDKTHISIRYEYNNVQKPQSVGLDFNNTQKPQF